MTLDRPDRLCDRHCQTLDMQFGTACRVERQGVRTNEFLQRRLIDTLTSGTAQHAVCHHRTYTLGSAIPHHFGCFAKRSCRIGNIIEDDHILTVHITQHTDLDTLLNSGRYL